MVGVVTVDASLALKWVLDEEFSAQADALFTDSVVAGKSIEAPPLWRGEVTNAIYQKERRGLIASVEADATLQRLLAFPVKLTTVDNLYSRALTFARDHDLPATYDAQYIVLAQILGAELWTADQKLARSLPPSVSWVRWIGEYS